jgi:hypothetical protein
VQTLSLALAGMMVVSSGCRCRGDDGGVAYARAKERSEALLRTGTPPSDPAFDPILRDLESVPFESRFHAPATTLREALMRARSLAPRPLVEGTPSEDTALAKKQAECVSLAQAMGRADAGERGELARKLEACRTAIDRYREQQHDSQSP